MPLTAKGKTIRKSMQDTYGHEKGEQVFQASAKKGSIKGVKKMKRQSGHKSGHSAHNPGGPISRAMKKTNSAY